MCMGVRTFPGMILIYIYIIYLSIYHTYDIYDMNIYLYVVFGGQARKEQQLFNLI